MKNIFDLTNKTIIVSGGAGYLGIAISEGFAEQGANVVIASRDILRSKVKADALNRKSSGSVVAEYLDVSSEDSIKKLYKKIIEDFGNIDVLVNNAHYSAIGTVENMSMEDWNFGIDGTLNNVFRCSKLVLPHMISNEKGNIINVSSMYGVVSPDPSIYENSSFSNPPNYGAGKAGIIQFTRYLACHYGHKGIRANAISPGPFPNEEVQENKNFISNLSKKVPLARIGKPEELQGATIFLASDASSYVTGHNLAVDGGWTSW